jgi:hypothetical protein
VAEEDEGLCRTWRSFFSWAFFVCIFIVQGAVDGVGQVIRHDAYILWMLRY